MIDIYDSFPRADELAWGIDCDAWYKHLVEAYYKERIRQIMMDIIWANLNNKKKIMVADINEYISDYFNDMGYTVKKVFDYDEEPVYFISWDICD